MPANVNQVVTSAHKNLSSSSTFGGSLSYGLKFIGIGGVEDYRVSVHLNLSLWKFQFNQLAPTFRELTRTFQDFGAIDKIRGTAIKCNSIFGNCLFKRCSIICKICFPDGFTSTENSLSHLRRRLLTMVSEPKRIDSRVRGGLDPVSAPLRIKIHYLKTLGCFSAFL